jgi:hypothetical protein
MQKNPQFSLRKREKTVYFFKPDTMVGVSTLFTSSIFDETLSIKRTAFLLGTQWNKKYKNGGNPKYNKRRFLRTNLLFVLTTTNTSLLIK